VTVIRSGDESGATQDRGDHESVVAGLSAKGSASVAGKLDARSTQLPTLIPHDPAIQTARERASPRDGDRPLDHTLVGAGGAAIEAGRDRRTDPEALRLRGADVLTSCSPYDRGVLERAIDRFLEQLNGSGATTLPGLGPLSKMIPEVVVVAATLAFLDAMRRRSRNARDEAGTGDIAEDFPHSGFPGLPGRRRVWAPEEQ
jgi:hypothetical protein